MDFLADVLCDLLVDGLRGGPGGDPQNEPGIMGCRRPLALHPSCPAAAADGVIV